MLLLRHKPTHLPLHQHIRLHWLLIVRVISDLETRAQTVVPVNSPLCLLETDSGGLLSRSGKENRQVWEAYIPKACYKYPKRRAAIPTENCSEW